MKPDEDPPPSYSTACNQHVPEDQAGPTAPSIIEFTAVQVETEPEPSNSLESLINANNVFRFRKMDTGMDDNATVVQIRGNNNQLLMSVSHTLIRPNHDGGSSCSRKIVFSDPRGSTLITLSENYRETTLIVNGDGDRHFGNIRKQWQGVHARNLAMKGENPRGEKAFSTERRGSFVYFYSRRNRLMIAGTTIAVHGRDFILEFKSAVDFNTKVLVIAAAYFLNLMYFEYTCCGMACARWCGPIFIILLMVVFYLVRAFAF